jgi:hypothetical protein
MHYFARLLSGGCTLVLPVIFKVQEREITFTWFSD